MMIKIIILFTIACSSITTNLYASGSSKPKKPKKVQRYVPPSIPKKRYEAPRDIPKKAPPKPSFVNRYYSNCVNNVEYKFNRISKKYRIRGWLNVQQKHFYHYAYRMHLFNKNTFGLENHFQGIAKLSGKGNFLITGADYKRREAHLFSVRNNIVVRKTIINRGKFWHSGGIQAAGQVLAVPIEPYKTGGYESLIQFFDIRNHLNPIKLPVQLHNPTGLAPALGFYRRREDLKYVLVAWDKLYISKTSNILHGFRPPQTIKGAPWGQGSTLVRDCKTKEFYLMSFMNEDKLSPLRRGKDRIQFQKLQFTDKYRETGPYFQGISTTYYTSKYFSCNFNAATHITAFYDRFVIYATHHYRGLSGYRIYLCNFY